MRFEKPLCGMLATNKPRGMISKDVTRWLEARIGRQKIGHVGTLDPMAEGVLCLLFGSATRLQDYLLDLPKTYEFDMKLGIETDTFDADGSVVAEANADHVTGADIEATLAQFRGKVRQVPPVFSAVKFKGRPLYDYARKDESALVPVEDLARVVEIESLELLKFEDGVATLRTRCSKGTYVRSLVRDIAKTAGSIATLIRLVRTEASGIQLNQCLTLEQIESSIQSGPMDFASQLLPPEQLALGLPVWQAVHQDCQARLLKGQTVSVSADVWLANISNAEQPGIRERLTTPQIQTVMVDQSGRAFGLGETKPIDGGRFLISMKRGLS